jgi:hypothetical protein
MTPMVMASATFAELSVRGVRALEPVVNMGAIVAASGGEAIGADAEIRCG